LDRPAVGVDKIKMAEIDLKECLNKEIVYWLLRYANIFFKDKTVEIPYRLYSDEMIKKFYREDYSQKNVGQPFEEFFLENKQILLKLRDNHLIFSKTFIQKDCDYWALLHSDSNKVGWLLNSTEYYLLWKTWDRKANRKSYKTGNRMWNEIILDLIKLKNQVAPDEPFKQKCIKLNKYIKDSANQITNKESVELNKEVEDVPFQ
jgi:hypothetical protein